MEIINNGTSKSRNPRHPLPLQGCKICRVASSYAEDAFVKGKRELPPPNLMSDFSDALISSGEPSS